MAWASPPDRMGAMPPNDPEPTRVYAIVNPARRGSGRAARLLAAETARRGWALTVLRTTVAEPGATQARAALDAGASRVVVAGGDGTVRLVAGELAGTGIPLGIVAIGTANLFARNAGLRPGASRRAVAVACGGVRRPFDVGWSRHRRGSDWSTDEPFLVVAGLGHDAATVLATRARAKRALRWLAYLAAGALHLFRAPFEASVSVDGRAERSVRTWCVLAGNAGRLPAGVRVFPDAETDDGVLDTLVVPIRHPWEWAAIAAKGLLRLRRPVRALEYGRGREIVVRPVTPQPLQLDGDAVTDVAEVAWRVAASELVVLVPPRKRRT